MLSKILSVSALAAAARALSISVASSGGNSTSAYQYGLMFEDINNSGDGGVYAELVQNRAFQGDDIYPRTLDWWNATGGASLSLQNLTTPLSAALPTSMQVTAGNASANTIGFSNLGYWGFPAIAGWEYKGSFWVEGGLDGNVTVCISGYDDVAYAEASVEVSPSTKWTQYNYTFSPTVTAPNTNNTLNFTFAASDLTGAVNFNLLSLFPPTYRNRENGLRVDLMEAMADLHPAFFRMPGGNNIEGLRPPHWWNFTQTIGPLVDRQGYPDTWGYENTNGLGLIEYLLWAQDLGMAPVLAVWSGLYLNGTVLAEDQLGPYIQAALDEIEFCMGNASTAYGALRESMGYGPFEINFVEVGNEDSLYGGDTSYRAYRFDAFYNAIHAAYPDMTIIASFYDVDGATPPFNAAGDFHEYSIPAQMSSQFNYFDNYTSEHPVLIGEYAVVTYDDSPGWANGSLVWTEGINVNVRAFEPFWYGTVAEAVFLLGAERNSDKIIGASYAPGFQNLNRWIWIDNLITFDANPAHTTLSTSWHMLQLLGGTRITENLPMTITNGGFGPAYFVAGRSAVTGAHIAKFAVYNGTESFDLSFAGVGVGATGNLTFLTAPMNASQPIGGNIVQTHVQTVRAGKNGVFSFDLPEYSIAVLEVGATTAGSGHHYGSAANRHGWKSWKSWGRDKSHHGSLNQWGQSY